MVFKEFIFKFVGKFSVNIDFSNEYFFKEVIRYKLSYRRVFILIEVWNDNKNF